MSIEMETRQQVYSLFTYRYYPRVYYYHKRVQDLFLRFSQLVGVFPEKIIDRETIEGIGNEVKIYSMPPRLLVYSNSDLDLSQIVVSMAPENEIVKPYKGSGINLVVFYIEIGKLVDQGQKIAQEVIQSYTEQDETMCPERMFVLCKIDLEEPNTQYEIRRMVSSVIQGCFSMHTFSDNQIIIAPSDERMGNKISNYLEKSLLQLVDRMQLYLEGFLTKGQGQIKGDILNQTNVSECLLELVSNKPHIDDIIDKYEQDPNMSTQTEGLPEDEKQLVYIIEELTIITKCAISSLLAVKYKLPHILCADMLHEMGACDKLKKSLSLNTKSILKRLLRSPGNKMNYQRHEYMVEKIKNDLTVALKEIEDVLGRTREMTLIMEKMIFEISGYFKQSVVWKKEPSVEIPQSNLSLKKKILGVNNVYGVGTIYGKLEIHLSQEDVEAEKEIQDILRHNSYFKPYTIKVVGQQPVDLADIQHENGKALFTQVGVKEVKGTLGGFVENESKENLYALTCAHVVRLGASQNDKEVFIKERQIRRRLGVSTENLSILPSEKPYLDIAAVTVADDIRNSFVRFLQDDDGKNRHAYLATRNDMEAFEALYVYKYGATSGLTKGIVCAYDYMNQAIAQMNMPDFVILVESLPAQMVPFAERGDSGSVVCLPTPGDDNITALSMLQAGEFRLGNESTDKILTVLLQCGLESISSKAGEELYLCS